MKNAYYENVNGKQIFCILTEPDSPQNKIVIMNHGFRGTSIGPARTFIDFAKIDPECRKEFEKLRGRETGFGWEEPLLDS